jgi:hypothetical protein
MPRVLLKKADGKPLEVDEGESAIITGRFYDATGVPLNKVSIITLKLTLINAADKAVINGRDEQSIKDEHGGSLADTADGYALLTLKLLAADNPIVGVVTGRVESHYALVEWTWIDSEDVEHVGKQEWEIHVRPVADGI